MADNIMDLQLTKITVAEAGILIRKPTTEVYEAFVDPEITTKFWLTKSTGRLEVGKRLRWDWEMYGVCSNVQVKTLEPGRRILIEWTANNETTIVEWSFTMQQNGTTFITITNYGFIMDGDRVVQAAKGAEAGFKLVLAGLKAYLEHGIRLNLVADRYSKQIVNRNTPGDSRRTKTA